MAAVNPNIDGKDLADTITAAINTAVEKATEKLLAAKAPAQPNGAEGFFGYMRAQILANVQVISRLITSKAAEADGDSFLGDGPPISVVVSGHGSSIKAHALVACATESRTIRYRSFVASKPMGSPEEAVRDLLNATMRCMETYEPEF